MLTSPATEFLHTATRADLIAHIENFTVRLEKLEAENQQLRAENQQLKNKLALNSQNSSDHHPKTAI